MESVEGGRVSKNTIIGREATWWDTKPNHDEKILYRVQRQGLIMSESWHGQYCYVLLSDHDGNFITKDVRELQLVRPPKLSPV